MHDRMDQKVLSRWARAQQGTDFTRVREILREYPNQFAARGGAVTSDRITLSRLADEYRKLTSGVEVAIGRMPEGPNRSRARVLWDQVGNVFDLGEGRALLACTPSHLHMALGRMATLWLELEGLVCQVM